MIDSLEWTDVEHRWEIEQEEKCGSGYRKSVASAITNGTEQQLQSEDMSVITLPAHA